MNLKTGKMYFCFFDLEEMRTLDIFEVTESNNKFVNSIQFIGYDPAGDEENKPGVRYNSKLRISEGSFFDKNSMCLDNEKNKKIVLKLLLYYSINEYHCE